MQNRTNNGVDIEEFDRRLRDDSPRNAKVLHIRDLIAALECCHHKAARHVEIIIEAIGRGETDKGPGRWSRGGGGRTPAEQMWRDAVTVLRTWVAREPSHIVEHLRIGDVEADELFSALGPRTALKVWQVQRVIDRIASFIDPSRPYDYLQCPDFLQYDDELSELEFRFRTKRTYVLIGADEPRERLSLALAIDMLMPCNWNFAHNLLIVARAIGGHLTCAEPFAACGRCITLAPIRETMRRTVDSLRRFCGDEGIDPPQINPQIIEALGEATPTKVWLAATLMKTIASQLNL